MTSQALRRGPRQLLQKLLRLLPTPWLPRKPCFSKALSGKWISASSAQSKHYHDALERSIAGLVISLMPPPTTDWMKSLHPKELTINCRAASGPAGPKPRNCIFPSSESSFSNLPFKPHLRTQYQGSRTVSLVRQTLCHPWFVPSCCWTLFQIGFTPKPCTQLAPDSSETSDWEAKISGHGVSCLPPPNDHKRNVHTAVLGTAPQQGPQVIDTKLWSLNWAYVRVTIHIDIESFVILCSFVFPVKDCVEACFGASLRSLQKAT